MSTVTSGSAGGGGGGGGGVEVCRFWLQHRCKRGKSCHFQHPKPNHTKHVSPSTTAIGASNKPTVSDTKQSAAGGEHPVPVRWVSKRAAAAKQKQTAHNAQALSDTKSKSKAKSAQAEPPAFDSIGSTSSGGGGGGGGQSILTSEQQSRMREYAASFHRIESDLKRFENSFLDRIAREEQIARQIQIQSQSQSQSQSAVPVPALPPIPVRRKFDPESDLSPAQWKAYSKLQKQFDALTQFLLSLPVDAATILTTTTTATTPGTGTGTGTGSGTGTGVDSKSAAGSDNATTNNK